MSRCVRQWRHLKDIKRGMGGHALAVDDLGDGALAIECPACPHPGRNLPPEWENKPSDKAYTLLSFLCSAFNNVHYRWLYSLFVAIDANFKLKLKSRGIKDPELGSGLAYFVNAEKFKAHLKAHVDEDEVSVSSLFFVRRRIYVPRDRDLWDRVPRSKSGKLEAIKRFHCFWRGRNSLSTRSCPQERRC